jgi:hypothetical protein
VDRKISPRPALTAAAYIAKYLTKNGRRGLRELALTQQAPRRSVYVHRQLTADTRCTMRNLRARRFVWWRWRVRVSCREAEAVWYLAKAFDGELVPPDALSAEPSAVP